MAQGSVDVSVEHSEEVNANHGYDAEVAVASVEVLARFEDVCEPGFIEVFFASSGREEVHIRASSGVVVHNIGVSASVVAQHAVVPRGSVSQTEVTADDDRKFPVATVVDLSQPGEESRHPDGASGVWVEFDFGRLPHVEVVEWVESGEDGVDLSGPNGVFGGRCSNGVHIDRRRCVGTFYRASLA